MNWDAIKTWMEMTMGKPLFSLAGTEVTSFSIVTFFVIIIITFIVSWIVQRFLGKTLGRRMIKEGTFAAIRRLVHYLVLFVGLGVALQTVGIKMNALFAAGAVFAVAIGFAMQNVVQNFVSGIILLVERTIKPGDILDVDGTVIKVVEMGIRTTVGRTLLEEDIIIPNSILSQSAVKNLTLKNDLYLIGTKVGVEYNSDMKKVIDVLTETAQNLPWRVKEKEPNVLMSEFANSSVDFSVWVALPNPWRRRYYISELNKAIWFAFKASGITIAFPQVDVHLDEPVVSSLKRLEKAV